MKLLKMVVSIRGNITILLKNIQLKSLKKVLSLIIKQSKNTKKKYLIPVNFILIGMILMKDTKKGYLKNGKKIRQEI